MKRKTRDRIVQAFNDAEDEFGEDKSTEFLATIVSERCNVEYVTVFDALIDYEEAKEREDKK